MHFRVYRVSGMYTLGVQVGILCGLRVPWHGSEEVVPALEQRRESQRPGTRIV